MNNTTNLTSFMQELKLRQESLALMWASISTYFIFIMQIGFAFLHVGNIRFRFTQSAIIKKLINISTSSLIFWIVGLGVSFGEDSNGFLGDNKYINEKLETPYYTRWMFHFAYAITCTSIFSGCVAERIKMLPFILFNCFFIGFIYPVGVHWCWGDGWLEKLKYHDFSGSGIIHLIGGSAGLAGGLLLGPRKGKFEKTAKYRKVEFLPSNMGFIALGTFTLWLGWYGLNCGAASPIVIGKRSSSSSQNLTLIGKIAINSSLAPAICGPVAFFLHYIENRHTSFVFSLRTLCNGVLAGLVSVSASCDNIKPWAAVIIAFFAGFIYHFSNKLQDKFKFDDPLNGLSIHMFCGLWGSIMVGFFDETNGIFYGNDGYQLGIQILGCVINFLWAFIVSFIILSIFKNTSWIGLRISQEEEEEGSDVLYYGGYSLNLDMDHLMIRRGEVTLHGRKIKLTGITNFKLNSDNNEEILKTHIKSYDFESNELMEIGGVYQVNKVTS